MQVRLRNRVVSVTYQQLAGESYDHATHYTYDIHGNVKTLVQDNALQNINLTSLPVPANNLISTKVGMKMYEGMNHLGNVLAVFTDRKIPVTSGTSIISFNADIVTNSDYFAFGSAMPGRGYRGSGYRYGFNGMEKDDEVKGSGNSYDFGARIYDPRIGRWLSVDPMANKQPGWSPYKSFLDNPIKFIDPDGNTETTVINVYDHKGQLVVSHRYVSDKIKVTTDGKIHGRTDITGEGDYSVNEYYNSEITINFTLTADGKSVASTSSTNVLLYDEDVQLEEGVYSGGDKAGESTWSVNQLIAPGKARCHLCGDNSEQTQAGGIVFSGSNPIVDGLEDALKEMGAEHVQQIDQNVLGLVGGMGGAPGNNFEKVQAIVDAVTKGNEVIEEYKTQKEKKLISDKAKPSGKEKVTVNGGDIIFRDKPIE